MTGRADIASGRLEYTCNCGWIDWGHARPGGASALWRQIWHERSNDDRVRGLVVDLEGLPAFAIHYRQTALFHGMRPGYGQMFVIRRGLSAAMKKRVTLAIFMRVSHGFEGLQRFVLSSSGYATDDLISNLVGFYRAVNGYAETYAPSRCAGVGAAETYKVFDAGHYEGHQWERFDRPQYFPCTACPPDPTFPPEFQTITPARPGTDFVHMDMIPSPDHALLSLGRPLSATRHGQVIVR